MLAGEGGAGGDEVGGWALEDEQAAVVADDAVAHGLAGLGGGEGPVHVLHDLAPPASLPGKVVAQSPGLVGRHAQQGLAVELVTGQDGQGGSGSWPGRSRAPCSAACAPRVEDCPGAGLKGRLA